MAAASPKHQMPAAPAARSRSNHSGPAALVAWACASRGRARNPSGTATPAARSRSSLAGPCTASSRAPASRRASKSSITA